MKYRLRLLHYILIILYNEPVHLDSYRTWISFSGINRTEVRITLREASDASPLPTHSTTAIFLVRPI